MLDRQERKRRDALVADCTTLIATIVGGRNFCPPVTLDERRSYRDRLRSKLAKLGGLDCLPQSWHFEARVALSTRWGQ
jgi:hypothetical protein